METILPEKSSFFCFASTLEPHKKLETPVSRGMATSPARVSVRQRSPAKMLPASKMQGASKMLGASNLLEQDGVLWVGCSVFSLVFFTIPLERGVRDFAAE